MFAILSTKGRYGRLEFLGIVVVQFVLLFLTFMIASMTLVSAAPGLVENSVSGMAGGIMAALVALGGFALSIWIGFCAILRRTRDVGWSVGLVAGVYAFTWLPAIMAVLVGVTSGWEEAFRTWTSLQAIGLPANIIFSIINLALIFKGTAPHLPPRGLEEWQARKGGGSEYPQEYLQTDVENMRGMENALEAMIAARRNGEAALAGVEKGFASSSGGAAGPSGFAATTPRVPPPDLRGVAARPAQRGGFGKRGT